MEDKEFKDENKYYDVYDIDESSMYDSKMISMELFPPRRLNIYREGDPKPPITDEKLKISGMKPGELFDLDYRPGEPNMSNERKIDDNSNIVCSPFVPTRCPMCRTCVRYMDDQRDKYSCSCGYIVGSLKKKKEINKRRDDFLDALRYTFKGDYRYKGVQGLMMNELSETKESIHKKYVETSRELFGYYVREQLQIKDIKFSGPKVIVFWSDDTKTIVTMDEDEKEYDVEKAIMAAYTRKILSYGKNSNDRSLNKMIDKWTKKYKSEKEDIEKSIEKYRKKKERKE